MCPADVHAQLKPPDGAPVETPDEFHDFDYDDALLEAPNAVQPLSVLVVEDTETDLMALKRCLQLLDTYDIALEHAKNSADVADCVKHVAFDLAIVDYWLGDETAALVLKELGGREGQIPAILLSGMPGQDVKAVATRAGAIFCIDKNQLSPVLLESTIRSTLHTHDLEQRHQAAIVELEQANRAKADFFSNMSRNLITPLNRIISGAEAIASDALGEGGTPGNARAATLIKDEGSQIRDVLNNLIMFGLGERPRATSKRRYNVNLLVEEALVLMDGLRERRGHRLESKPLKEPVLVRCEKGSLVGALVNVVSNALHYTPEGGDIRVGLECKHNKVVINVTDNGIGMSNDELAIALAPFGRIPLPPGLSVPGTGLGLPITRNVIADHGGQLTIDSSPGKGTTISLRLPIAPKTDPKPETAERTTEAGL